MTTLLQLHTDSTKRDNFTVDTAMGELTVNHLATAIWLDRPALDLTVTAYVGVGRVEAVTAADGHRGVERLPATQVWKGHRRWGHLRYDFVSTTDVNLYINKSSVGANKHYTVYISKRQAL